MAYRRLGTTRLIWSAVAAAVVLLSCASCMQLERVQHPEVDAQELVGRMIMVTTIGGQVHEFRLLEVTEDALVGEFERIPFDTIALVERRDFDVWKTVLLVGGGSVVALAALAGVFLIAMMTWDGP